MKLRNLFFPLLFLSVLPIAAQDIEHTRPDIRPAELATDSLATPLAIPQPGYSYYANPSQRLYAPGIPYDLDFWQLHKGFNASLTFSATVGFGKNSPSGVGLGEHAAFMYALPLTPRLSVAGGIYTSNFNWGGWQSREMGIAALAAYQLNPQFTAYVYGNKSIVSRQPRPVNFLQDRGGDCIGAMIDWHPNETVNIQLRIESREYPNRQFSHKNIP